jgi:hypothetical protein
MAKHFEHCQEKVEAGEGFKGEDCVEELYVPLTAVFKGARSYLSFRCKYMPFMKRNTGMTI